MEVEELKIIVENALQEIRPYLQADGGNITLVDIQDNIVSVQLEGNCLGCSVNQMTLKNGDDASIKRHAPPILQEIEVNGITF